VLAIIVSVDHDARYYYLLSVALCLRQSKRPHNEPPGPNEVSSRRRRKVHVFRLVRRNATRSRNDNMLCSKDDTVHTRLHSQMAGGVAVLIPALQVCSNRLLIIMTKHSGKEVNYLETNIDKGIFRLDV
jgi:hypothetical protein